MPMQIVSNIALVSINETVFVQLISFLIFLFIINRVMFRPLRDTMLKRDQHVNRIQDDITAQENQLQTLKNEISARESSVRSAALEMKKKLEDSGNQEAAAIYSATRQEIEVLRKKSALGRRKQGVGSQEVSKTSVGRDRFRRYGKSPGSETIIVKFFKNNTGWRIYAVVVAASLHLTELNALASESGANWRPTFDLVMIWLNFGIFAFLLVKYLKTPLINFLRGRQDELTREINRLEEKRDQISQKIHETQQRFEKSEAHYETIKANIITQGEEKKERSSRPRGRKAG